MLLILTGNIQIGKTRWLQGCVSRLEDAGVVCEGVLAPGVWRDHAGEGAVGEGAAAKSSAARFEKLGIDNVLLPGHAVVPFARRADLAMREGTYDAACGAAKEGLTWNIPDSAVAEVNRHFDALAEHVSAAHAAAEAADAGRAGGEGPCGPRRLLVVDELGRLELMANCGLTSAMGLLARGPQGYYDLALVVVRELFGLNERARDQFGEAWGGAAFVSPCDATWEEWLAPLCR